MIPGTIEHITIAERHVRGSESCMSLLDLGAVDVVGTAHCANMYPASPLDQKKKNKKKKRNK